MSGTKTTPKEEKKEQSQTDIKQDSQVDMDVDSDSKYIDFSVKINTRKSNRLSNKKLNSLSLKSIIERLIDIENKYTQTANDLSKSWAPKSAIEQIRHQLQE